MRPSRHDDGGFAMVFVLMVIAMASTAVAAVLAVTTPDIARTKADQDGQGADAAARAAVDDFIAYLSGIDACRSTTRVCRQARGATMPAKTIDAPTRTTVAWSSAQTLTAAGNVRVTATGTYGAATRTLQADLALAPSILSYGYYSDYESLSSQAVARINKARTIRIDTSGSWNAVSVADLSRATTATWGTPANTPACDRHWWDDSSTSPTTTGRNDGVQWNAAYSFDTVSTTNKIAGGCDIIFATGMTLDGPVYTRDALLVDGSGGSGGPVFQAPVLTGWGSAGRNSPAVPATTSTTGPWRQQKTGTLSGSPYKPKKADFDLALPDTIGSEGLADNACVYRGPTRVKLNGDGTATITSPRTTAKAATADPACYPGTIGSQGVLRWTVPYGTVGGGTVLVKDLGTEPSTGWPLTGQKTTSSPASSTSALWSTATAAVTPSNGTSTAGNSCSSFVTYSAAVGASCAWSEAPSYSSTSGGWTAFTSGGSCSTTYPATNQRLFECEYTAKVGSAKVYADFRTAAGTAFSASACATPGIADAARQTCLATALAGVLPADTTARRYVVTASTAAAATGTVRALGSAPAFPQADDPIFANGPTSAGSESSTPVPVTLAVTRQASTDGGKTWQTAVDQFKVTVTSTTWAVASSPSAVSYFPSVKDVTPYAAGTGANVAGDVYVDGTNKGKLSVLADNDVVVTNNLLDASSDVTADAVNLVAGQDVRNYHPVSCLSTNSDSIARTTAGFCPNDITYLGNPGSSGADFDDDHPAMQYTNLQSSADRTIAAAVFALTGSLTSDNYNRGNYMGKLQIEGGVYQGHRGVNGSQSPNNSGVARTGYLLQYRYVDLRQSDLPYEPTTRVKSGRVWSVVSVAVGPS